MDNLLKDLIFNKNILILGFGREGKSTLEKLERVGYFKSITIADINDIDTVYPKIIGNNYQDNLDDFDIVFKSPGVVLNKDINEYKCLITSQMDLFLKCYKEQCIGITGSKGKSTTSSFCNHLLSENGYKTVFGGNIGTPVFSLIDDIDEKTIIVLEISCHQLEFIHNNPKIAVLLNIFEEHLDHYHTFDKYKHAKENIYRFQNNNNFLFISKNNKPVKYIGKEYIIDDIELPFKSFEEIGSKLRGEQYLYDLKSIYGISKLFNINDESFINSLKTFIPLEHRLEYVGNKKGIDFYNDSISTIVESCLSAIKAIENIETILIGGMDRGIDYSSLINYLNLGKVKNVICMYASGKRIFENLTINAYYEEDIEKAFYKAIDLTQKGKAIVLSPASASYGYFKNFEERGKYFKELVNKL